MDDYIKREDAIDAAAGWGDRGLPLAILEDIKTIPAAEVVEVRHGEWVKVHDEVCYWLACSVCGEEIPKRFGTDYYTNYCPNCGAKMDRGRTHDADDL